MNFEQKRTILFYLLVFFLFSCKKDVSVHIPQQNPKLVVNCLFNPDSTWKVFVGKSTPLEDTSASMINDASVTISGNGQTIHLTYLDKGYYISNLKPLVGINYTIKASAPGFHPVEASDSIPSKLTIIFYTFDTIPIIITDLDVLAGEKVNKLVLSIDGLNQKSYAQVRIPAYNKYDLYYYTITDSTLNKTSYELKESPYAHFLDIPSVISKLSTLKGRAILSETGFRNKVNTIVGIAARSIVDKIVVKYAERKPTSKHLEDLFVPNGIYAQQQPFYNIFDENYYSAFAEGKNSLNKNNFLFYSSYEIFNPKWGYGDDPLNAGKKKKLELWVDLISLSEAAFQFKTTFIKQQLNRENLFRRPVQVYSNINGGLGIFAGYQKERIRIY